MSVSRDLRRRLNGDSSTAAEMLRAWSRGEVDNQGNPVPEEPPQRHGPNPDYSQGRGGPPPRFGGGNALNGQAPLDAVAEALRASDPGANITVNNSPRG